MTQHQSNRAVMAEAFADEDVIDLRKVWGAVMRHKWGIITLPLLVAMLSYLYASTLTPIFQGTSTLLIQPPTSNVVGIQGVESTAASREHLATQFELLKSRAIAEAVVNELNLINHPEFAAQIQADDRFSWRSIINWRAWVETAGLDDVLPTTRPEDIDPVIVTADERLERAVNAFRNRVGVEPRRNTQLVDISVEMADPATAAQAANALARNYIERQIQSRLEMTEQATDWMSRRLSELKEELDASERRLQTYVEQEDLVDMGGVTTVEAAELSQINDRLVDARQAFARAENEFRQIADYELSEWRDQATTPAVRSNSLVAEFIAAEVRARARVEELAQRYGPQHPRMIEARDELNAATESLRGQVEQVVASIEQSYQLSQSNLRSLEATFNDNREAIRSVQSKAAQFRQLQREVDSNRTLYDRFLNRLNETSATADIEDANARIVDLAITPRSPVKPRVGQITIIAAVLAFMLAVGMALLREQLDNRLRTSSDVEEKLTTPMLGLLPLQKQHRLRSDLARLYHKDSERTFSEAIRTIRTSVVLSGLDNPHKRIVVTSSIPGEGKTSLACNLSVALGQMERVLLIEADMRKPTLRRVYGIARGQPGLADVVARNATLDDAIHHFDGIDVMACGTLPPNPLELLSSKRFSNLLEQLDHTYDRIVIDAPPVQAVTDPLVLSTYANAVIYMVKADSTPAPLARKGLSRLAEVNAPVTGVVLGHVDVDKASKYGYGYKYADAGYYDYYGYSSGEKA